MTAISAYEDKVDSLSAMKADLESQRDGLQAELVKEKERFAQTGNRLDSEHSSLVKERESLGETIASMQKEIQGNSKILHMHIERFRTHE